jgi:hypothetical protein
MPPPHDYTLPPGVEAHRLPNGFLSLSGALVELLIQARSAYEWPAGIGAAQSQQTILTLEADVTGRMQRLTEENAHHIVTSVSVWAGNNVLSHNAIVRATPEAKVQMLNSLQLFNSPNGLLNAIDGLCSLPGIRLAIASKIFRFCCPASGAAVDRHTSYFFNSLEVISPEKRRDRSTNFRREWSNGQHTASRLAIHQPAPFAHNLDQFISVYLQLLDSIANTLNAIPIPYNCAATTEQKQWRPTDVEMAAYYWGAGNGAR